MEPKTSLNDSIKCIGILRRAKAGPQAFNISLIMIAYDYKKIVNSGYLSVSLADKSYGMRSYKKRFRTLPIIIKTFKVQIPYADIINLGIHSRVNVNFLGDDRNGYSKPIIFSLIKGLRGPGKSKALITFDETNTTMYVRQSVNNWVHITQRRRNKSDDKKFNKKITLAYYLSLIFWRKRIIILFEKESEKFEESASILFMSLIDRGYRNTYFVLDPNSSHAQFVPEKYNKYILKKHTIKHYLYFFVSKTFLGTEMPAHAIDLRVANKHAVRKINSKRIRYVFLQHGVMYFLALSSKARRAARKNSGNIPINTKTVVSSQLEAKHFVEHGNYDIDDLYITGLPKFDKNTKDEDAKKIVIMPTWRPWEYNQIRNNPEKTPYYKMLTEIIDAIPQNLKSQIQLLPHPLFIREVANSKLSKYIKRFNSYDEVLRQTDVLITDYSSVSADAFYRGSKVIFWWKDKDDCMEKYGGKLMLNRRNIFGDIATNSAELETAINNSYLKPQKEAYIRRFHKIVEFDDGNNTERLIKLLKKDRTI